MVFELQLYTLNMCIRIPEGELHICTFALAVIQCPSESLPPSFNTTEKGR